MNLKPLAAAAALAAGALPALATTTELNMMDDPVAFGFGYAVGAGSTLSDTYTFTLAGMTTLSTTAISNEAATLGLDGGMVSLYQGDAGSGQFVSAFAFDNTSITSVLTPLAAGDYYFTVGGTVGADDVAGSYALTVEAAPVTPVPEPQSVALMAAGLGALGFIARRRRPHS